MAVGQMYAKLINDVKGGVSGSTDVGVIGVMTTIDDSVNLFSKRTATAPEGLYGITAEIEIKVQYVYHGGQMSRLSNGIRLYNKNFNMDDAGYDIDEASQSLFSFGIGIVLHETTNQLVKGINIYRRIIDSGNPDLFTDDNYYLINTVWIDNESIREEDTLMGESSVARSFGGTEPENNTYGFADVVQTIEDYPRFFSAWQRQTSGSLMIEMSYGSDAWKGAEASGEFWRTRGWIKAGSSHLLYCQLHYGVAGTMKYGFTNNVGSTIYLDSMYAIFNGTFATTRFGYSNTIETTMMRAGAEVPMMRAKKTSDGSAIAYLNGYPLIDNVFSANYLTAFSGFGTHLLPDAFTAFSFNSLDSAAVVPGTSKPAMTYDFPEGQTRDGIPLLLWRDTGAVPADTEASFNGVVTEDLVIQKPRHMALAGGRFIGLNGFHDNDEKQTRAWYSQFQRFGMFNKNSYMDYGARDDGVGAGVSAFRGTTIFHFTSATYIIDVSGGFDMAWRELGAYTSIGLLHSRAITETPIGVFWGDKNDIYWFNGRSVENVSHMDRAKRTIRPTYRAMVQSDSDSIRLNYRADLRQVWVSQGNQVMVLDVDRMAWHKHVISEIGSDDEITNTIDVNDATFVITYDGSYSNIEYTSPTQDPTFDWGINFQYDANVPEVIKKAKRFYVDVEGDAKFTAIATGDDGSRISQRVKKEDGMIRFSASVRGRTVEMDLKTVEGRRWRGTIESIGMSHKLKNLK
jgi:hypothetical protein